ncbi:unnamed protein product [Paramecium octaurelia]|uniref:Uncharacterized protein n=1 Tax=Paramecium octaurelia TaxID=43137 RepID=A0A8S1YL60_PAROT|nr:unnamed protein product [Paramecium octaurelia]
MTLFQNTIHLKNPIQGWIIKGITFLKGILECCQERKYDRSYEYEGGEDFKNQNLTEEQIRIQQKNFTEALDTADYVIVKQSIISSDFEQGKSKKQSRGSWSQNKAGQFVKTDQDVVNNQDKHFNQMKIYVIDLNEGGKLTISEQTIPQGFQRFIQIFGYETYFKLHLKLL